jgi:ABC-type sugar transport system ATPase subunit
MNFFELTIKEERGQTSLIGPSLEIPLDERYSKNLQNYKDEKIFFGIRPEDLKSGGTNGEAGCVKAIVDLVEPIGSEMIIYAHTEAMEKLAVKTMHRVDYRIGESISLSLDLEKSHLFQSSTGKRIF